MECTHDWVKMKFIYCYIDYSGNKVNVFDCVCKNCGKRKAQKYI